MRLPTVHINGTSREALVCQQRALIETLDLALERMLDAAPNGRDYYPQDEGAFRAAANEHQERARMIQHVRDAHVEIYMYLMDTED